MNIYLLMDNVFQLIFVRVYFSNLGYGIILSFDLEQLGEMVGEIKVIQVINENVNYMIGCYKGRLILTCGNM